MADGHQAPPRAPPAAASCLPSPLPLGSVGPVVDLLPAPIVVDIASGPAVQGELPALLVEAYPRRRRRRVRARRSEARRDPAPGARRRLAGRPGLPPPAGRRRLRSARPRARCRRARSSSARSDPLPDRYRTAGLLVAALASERAGSATPPEPTAAEPTAAEPTAAEPAADAPPPRPLGWFLAVGGLVGNGLDVGPARAAGPARAGGWVMATALDRRSDFFGTLSVSYATALREPAPGLSVQWLALGAAAASPRPSRRSTPSSGRGSRPPPTG